MLSGEFRIMTTEDYQNEWAQPGIEIHQDVDRAGLAPDQIERRFNLGVDAMVAAYSGNPLIETLVIRR